MATRERHEWSHLEAIIPRESPALDRMYVFPWKLMGTSNPAPATFWCSHVQCDRRVQRLAGVDHHDRRRPFFVFYALFCRAKRDVANSGDSLSLYL